MARIPLEDNYDDVLNKAQRGLKITDEELAQRAEVPLEALRAVKTGKFDEAVVRRVAGHLRLNRDALVQLAQKTWYPQQPDFPRGFAAFNTPFEGGSVNSYLVWDERSGHAVAFDTGMSAESMLDLIAAERLNLRTIFITHTHDDHIADLARLAGASKAEVWASEREPVDFPGAKTFTENAYFHIGRFSIKTLFTWGHSEGGTTFFVTGLSYPLAIVGDSLFASSMGGAMVSYSDAYENNIRKIFTLPSDTVIASGHGPLTTVAQEPRHNPFFVR